MNFNVNQTMKKKKNPILKKKIKLHIFTKPIPSFFHKSPTKSNNSVYTLMCGYET